MKSFEIIPDEHILAAKTKAIVNPVNTVGVAGAGLAKLLAKRYPSCNLAYRRACEAGALRIGEVLVTLTGLDTPAYVVHFPTKRHWLEGSLLEHIESGLVALTREIRNKEIDSVALPLLGCGLGGLIPWDVIPLMRKGLEDCNAHVVLYTNNQVKLRHKWVRATKGDADAPDFEGTFDELLKRTGL